MGTTGGRRATALRCAAAAAACLLWGAPPAQAAATATATAGTALTSASWGVVVSNDVRASYPAGTTATVSGAVLADRYVVLAGTGTRSPGSVTYLFSGGSLLVNAFVCATPWTVATATCSGGQGTRVDVNTPVSGTSVVPAPGGVLHMKVNFLASGSGTFSTQASRPTAVTTNS